MSQPDFVQPYAPDLTNEQTQQAVKDLIVEYPKIVRSNRDDAIVNQQFANISMQLFETPREINGKNIYGFMKVRGNWSDLNQAQREASKIIRQQDSKHQIRIVQVGNWFPITELEEVGNAKLDKLDVKTEDDEVVQLRDEVSKEKERENEKKVKELQDRAEKLKSKDDMIELEKRDTIEHYTAKRRTEAVLTDEINKLQKKMDEIKEKRRGVWEYILSLDTHSQFKDEWLDVYNKALTDIGGSKWVPPKDQFKDFEEFTNTQ